MLFFGCCFPLNPLFPLGLDPLGVQPGGLWINRFEKPASASNGVVLKELVISPSTLSSPDHIANPPEIGTIPDSSVIIADSSSTLDDEDVLKRAKQGVSRTSKLKSLEGLELDCAKPGQVKKKRGRKPKSEAGPSILREISEGFGGIDPGFAELQATTAMSGSDKYFTRATKAWFLGKSVGLVFPGSDEEAIKGLAKELEEDQPVLED